MNRRYILLILFASLIQRTTSFARLRNPNSELEEGLATNMENLIWTDILKPFEDVARRVFQFLTDEKGYTGPAVEYARDFNLVYTHPNDGRTISIGLERDSLLPFISIETPTPTGHIYAFLPSALRKLNISVDSSQFPYCNKLLPYCEAKENATGSTFSKAQTIHEQHQQELRVEIAPFLEVYGGALQQNYHRIMEFAKTEEANDAVTLGGDGGCLSSALLALAFVLCWTLGGCF